MDSYKDYTKAYRAVAQHYGLPIWSYRDAVNSDFVAAQQADFSEWIRWSLNHLPMPFLEHPHWHAHLFQADLFAGALLALVAGCDATRADVALANELFSAPPAMLLPPLKLAGESLPSAACPVETLRTA